MSARATGWAVFETPIGACGVSWSDEGITHVQLPESSAAATRARLRRLSRDAPEIEPTPPIASAIAAIVALLAGQRTDLTTIALDLREVPAFDRRVYDEARTIAPGMIRTYGELAAAIGDPGAARAVGQALGRNPCPIIVPCHRVLAAAGQPGGFSANGGAQRKRQLLEIEGALPVSGRLWDI